MDSLDSVPIFFDLVSQLLDALSKVFEDCANTKSILEQFKLCDHESLEAQMEEWNTTLSPHYHDFKNKSSEGIQFLNFGVFQYIDIPGKWADHDRFCDENKDIFFDFMNQINMIVQTYCAIPKGIMKSMEGVMGTMMDQLKGDPKNLMNVDFASMSQQMFSNMTPESLQELQDGLPQMMKGIQGLLENPEFSNAFASMSGGMPGGMNPLSLLGNLTNPKK